MLIYPGGRQIDALLLSASADRLRLAIPGCSDAAELRAMDGNWFSESGVGVTVGALIACSTAPIVASLVEDRQHMRAAV
jgi:hypothetical protein